MTQDQIIELALALLKEQNEALRKWVRDQGEKTDTCTYNILREKCSYCRCHRSKT